MVINITNINTINNTRARTHTHTHIREYSLLIPEMFRNVWTIFRVRIHPKQKCCYSVVAQFVLLQHIHAHVSSAKQQNSPHTIVTDM